MNKIVISLLCIFSFFYAKSETVLVKDTVWIETGDNGVNTSIFTNTGTYPATVVTDHHTASVSTKSIEFSLPNGFCGIMGLGINASYSDTTSYDSIKISSLIGGQKAHLFTYPNSISYDMPCEQVNNPGCFGSINHTAEVGVGSYSFGSGEIVVCTDCNSFNYSGALNVSVNYNQTDGTYGLDWNSLKSFYKAGVYQSYSTNNVYALYSNPSATFQIEEDFCTACATNFGALPLNSYLYSDCKSKVNVTASVSQLPVSYRMKALVAIGYRQVSTELINIYIPDASFKANLVGNAAINTNGDGEIQLSEAKAFSGTISCRNLGINDLTGIGYFENVTELLCDSNSLTSLDLGQLPKLTKLTCSSNQLSHFNVSNNPDLVTLDCSRNAIYSVSFSNNLKLETVQADSCIYSQLDVSNLSNLKVLTCSNNSLDSVDVSANGKLISFEASNSQLKGLKFNNGNNQNVTHFDVTNNPSLNCIRIDDLNAVNNGGSWLKDAGSSWSTAVCVPLIDPVVYIPDTAFKQYLVGEASINTNLDAEIQVSEAEAFTGKINCGNKNINDLTGIAAFINLTELLCHQNNLTSLGVSKNTKLIALSFFDNSLTSLDVSKNLALETLWTGQNALGSIDVSKNVNLKWLKCNSNQLTSLDVSMNVNLDFLDCNWNTLTALDVSKNTKIKSLYGQINSIGAIDLSNNPSLEIINLFGNELMEIDFSTNPNLKELKFSVNKIDSVNLSTHVNLTKVEFDQNELVYFNIKNGMNTVLTVMTVNSNANLSCVEVDDSSYIETNVAYWRKDATAFWSETSCAALNEPVVNIPDAIFKKYLIDNSEINTNGDTEIQISEANTFPGEINCALKGIKDLTGIEYFTALTVLKCQFNDIAALDISSCTSLKFLMCSHNKLTSLDVSKNSILEELYFGDNSISSLNISSNSAIMYIQAHNNSISNIDLSACLNLKTITCANNQLSNIDVSKNTALYTLNCEGNNLTAIDVTNNVKLLYFFLGQNSISEINVENNVLLRNLNFPSIMVSEIDISKNLQLNDFNCENNKIEILDFSKHTLLKRVNCRANSLTSLNVKNGTNSIITSFTIDENPNLSCVQVDDSLYSATNWNDIDLQTKFNGNCNVLTTITDHSINSLQLYPNPSSGLFTISSERVIKQISIISQSGKLMQTINPSNGQKAIQIQIEKRGVYFVHVQTATSSQVLKAVVMK
ncbi:MAG: Leucine-rich repeat (LRR) protein [Glaciecola sp.]|jgi:Leucine-rich repeat (LRR) protein